MHGDAAHAAYNFGRDVIHLPRRHKLTIEVYNIEASDNKVTKP